MGYQGKKIVKVDTDKLLEMLNGALAEEWLAYYQYWVGARVIEGPLRSEVEPELLVHADEELNHANMLIDRIVQLDGTPILNPADWTKHANCAYEEPTDPYVEEVLKQNLNGERCAIRRYQDILDFTNEKDPTTYQMALNILNDELEHEQDIEDWIADLDRMKEDFKKLRM